MQHNADSMVHEMLTGGDVNSAEVLTAVQKADMAFRTLLQVRNKLIEAYREVLQIQV
jgi:flagellar hook-basal body complex protein FliE